MSSPDSLVTPPRPSVVIVAVVAALGGACAALAVRAAAAPHSAGPTDPAVLGGASASSVEVTDALRARLDRLEQRIESLSVPAMAAEASPDLRSARTPVEDPGALAELA